MPTTRSIRSIGLALLFALTALAAWKSYGFAAGRAQSQTELGARLYAENCAVCHGPNGEGRIGATLAKDWPSIKPEATTHEIISSGIPGSPMPPWSQAKGGPFTDSEIDAIVEYILSWQTGGAPLGTPYPTATARPPITPIPNVQGDPNLGAQLYDQNCAVCHGPNGQGRIGARLAKDWPSIRPDLTVKNTIANGIDNSPMPAWSQANGGPLSDVEINDITAYVMTFAASAQPQPTPTAAPSTSPLSGWSGVILFLVVGAVIVAVILLAQRRK